MLFGLSIGGDTVAAFAKLGVTRLIPLLPRAARRDADQILHFVRMVGERFKGSGVTPLP